MVGESIATANGCTVWHPDTYGTLILVTQSLLGLERIYIKINFGSLAYEWETGVQFDLQL